MFESGARRTKLGSAFTIVELIFHAVVRDVRKVHHNAFVAIGRNLMQIVIFVMIFYLMFALLGLRGSAIRGDFLLYLLSGIFLFITHTKALSAVSSAEGPNSPMMQHAPMNTMIGIFSAAIGCLYIQTLSVLIILFVYHMAVTPVHIEDPIGAYAMVLLAWFTGAALGVVLLSLKPWFPTFVGLFRVVYQRANMIASGKMFVANTMPGFMLAMFDWNPLFHTIDQARGYIFINYFPRYSSWEYAMWVGIVLLMLGLMGEFYTRRHVSVSWFARR